jgi:hypothetical protein
MKYSTFIPDCSLNDELSKLTTLRHNYIKQFAKENNLILLESDYLGMDSYYYDTNNKIMYKVCNICSSVDKSIKPIFEVSCDYHILQLNKLN